MFKADIDFVTVSWRPFQLSGISGMKIQLILETFQVKCAFQMAEDTPHYPHTRRHTYAGIHCPSQTWAFSSGFSQAGNPMLNVLPVDDAHAKGKRALCPVPCLSRRRRMTCQTRNCSDLGFSLPSLCCLSVGILIIVVDREAFRGFGTAYGVAQPLGHWPCAMTTGAKSYDIVQNDTQYLCYSFLYFLLFLSPSI